MEGVDGVVVRRAPAAVAILGAGLMELRREIAPAGFRRAIHPEAVVGQQPREAVVTPGRPWVPRPQPLVAAASVEGVVDSQCCGEVGGE